MTAEQERPAERLHDHEQLVIPSSHASCIIHLLTTRMRPYRTELPSLDFSLSVPTAISASIAIKQHNSHISLTGQQLRTQPDIHLIEKRAFCSFASAVWKALTVKSLSLKRLRCRAAELCGRWLGGQRSCWCRVISHVIGS